MPAHASATSVLVDEAMTKKLPLRSVDLYEHGEPRREETKEFRDAHPVHTLDLSAEVILRYFEMQKEDDEARCNCCKGKVHVFAT